ncbi:hypothetical protein FBUS_09292 [Fasciolopsis buskii]|uniref:Uncharacterized protein n=1 Tax=Fasciolopsis buskii TaxID=27845 RepID=A0A8E0S097_9TREM|nr:hypothetical protein FBUS_09292 [Fasciolopsis buski]
MFTFSSTSSAQTHAEGELLRLIENQIFLGLISMQQQVRPDVVEAIKQLEEACIRFVYFSRENELRSRVFAERLGLEYGWNCHISLANPSERRRSNPDHPAVSRDPPRTCRDYREDHPVVHSPVRRSRKSGLSSVGHPKSFVSY